MKRLLPFAVTVALCSSIFAQEMDFSDEAFFPSDFDDGFYSEDSFGYSDEDFFGSADDEFFEDDGIEELVVLDEKSSAIAKGALFETGSVRVGGSLSSSLSTYTSLYRDDDMSFGDRIKDSRISPSADASLFVDARPTDKLRIYTKFGIAYPYKDSISMGSSSSIDDDTLAEINAWLNSQGYPSLSSGMGVPDFKITNWLYLKELFTDFSIADRAFFRFGLHTVSWGAGFFFSPVSDMINTSSIDPENTDAQVNGSVNLRAQITFPNTQNCLWLYLIPPSTSAISSAMSDNNSLAKTMDDAMFPYLLKETAIAGKMDVVVSNWELGFGAVLRLDGAPKFMTTASGSIINGKVGVFGEAVVSYGTQTQWKNDSKNKDLIFQGTVGAMYMWNKPQITFMAQYYFDGNKDDHEYLTYGSNLAATINFSKIGETDLTANIFMLFYLGKSNVTTMSEMMAAVSGGNAFMPYAGIVSATLNWKPISYLSISAGPYITWLDMTKSPDVALKLGVTLGGGKF